MKQKKFGVFSSCPIYVSHVHMSIWLSKCDMIYFEFSSKLICDSLVHIHMVVFQKNKVYFDYITRGKKSALMLEMPKNGMWRLEHLGVKGWHMYMSLDLKSPPFSYISYLPCKKLGLHQHLWLLQPMLWMMTSLVLPHILVPIYNDGYPSYIDLRYFMVRLSSLWMVISNPQLTSLSPLSK
jgi:hypothetical protein